MLSCPIESSEEWIKIFAKAKGDRTEALKMWVEEGYAENDTLNEEPEIKADGEKVGDDVDDDIDTDREASLSKLVEKIKIHVAKELGIIEKKKIIDIQICNIVYNITIHISRSDWGIKFIEPIYNLYPTDIKLNMFMGVFLTELKDKSKPIKYFE